MEMKSGTESTDMGVRKAVMTALAVTAIAIGAAVLVSTAILTAYEGVPKLMGRAIIWAGCLVFFFAAITEEHMMKQLFLKQSLFFTGIVAMILGVFLVSLSGFTRAENAIPVMELGVLVLLGGAALMLLSAQKSRDYSKKGGFLGALSGVFLIVGGLVAGSVNVSYAGVFVIILSGIWLGLRSKYAI